MIVEGGKGVEVRGERGQEQGSGTAAQDAWQLRCVGEGTKGRTDTSSPSCILHAPSLKPSAHQASGNASRRHYVALPQKPVHHLAWVLGTRLSLGAREGDVASMWPAWWLDRRW